MNEERMKKNTRKKNESNRHVPARRGKEHRRDGRRARLEAEDPGDGPARRHLVLPGPDTGPFSLLSLRLVSFNQLLIHPTQKQKKKKKFFREARGTSPGSSPC